MRIAFLLIPLAFSGCIDEFPLGGSIPEPTPVIEGLVADVEGESQVRISSSLSIQGIRGTERSIGEGATVEVKDAQGNVFAFCEKSATIYRPEDESFSGTIGSTYQLFVTLSDGRSFQSRSEMMHPGVQVDSIFTVFKPSVIPGTGQLTGKHDFFVTVFTDPAASPVLFRTLSFGIAQVAADIDPPPPDCSGPPCPEICYSFRRPINRHVVAATTDGTIDNRLTLQVATEEYDFHLRYFIKVTTYSLSPEGNVFWSSIASQQQIDGSIFDPQLTEVEGTNMFGIDNNDAVIGYFGASSLSTDSLLINRFETAGFLVSLPTARNSCTEVWPSATLQVPEQFN